MAKRANNSNKKGQCVKRSGVVLPGFSDPSPEEIAWSMNMGGAGSWVNKNKRDAETAGRSDGVIMAESASVPT